jgi:AraC-like DNA-binding protein
VVAADVLQRFTSELGIHLHRLLHHGKSADGCTFDPGVHRLNVRLDPTGRTRWNIASSFAAWMREYQHASDRCHPEVLTARIKREIEANLHGLMPLRTLARRLACSVAVVERRLVQDSGETVGEYRTRMRTIEALDRLRHTPMKTDAIAREVGWQSRKDLYRAVRRLTGLTPRAVRRLSDSEYSALSDACRRFGSDRTRRNHRLRVEPEVSQ